MVNRIEFERKCLRVYGAPYKHGGEDQWGCDCSGIMRQATGIWWNAQEYYDECEEYSIDIDTNRYAPIVFYFDGKGNVIHMAPRIGDFELHAGQTGIWLYNKYGTELTTELEERWFPLELCK